MKNLFLLLILTLLLGSCATTKKASKNAMNDVLIGQNELVVIKSLGTPSNVIHTEEQKMIVYEYASEEPDLGHNNSNSNLNAGQNKQKSGGITFTSNVNKAANDPNYSIYEKKVTYLKIYIDKQGNCSRIENTLPQKQSELYLERIKNYNAKN